MTDESDVPAPGEQHPADDGEVLFGSESPTPARPRERAASGDIDWYAGLDDEAASRNLPLISPDPEGSEGPAVAGVAAEGVDWPAGPGPLMPETAVHASTDWDIEIQSLPDLVPAIDGDASQSHADGPLVDAALFEVAAGSSRSGRHDVYARGAGGRRRRVLALAVVLGVVALVGVAVAAVAEGDGATAKSEVKV